MGFFESMGFWFAAAMVKFLIGLGFVVLFVIILLRQETKKKRWQEKRDEQQRQEAAKISTKDTQSE